ncbi:MAG: hypothetical protein A2X36_08035 [Elusimicrobia bacterium GWA2_69_24]|nr:MAG: hypothetical protein A2X36_08035 [Elusimicrobia bacterium GWA2_69_24]HBL17449.1 hypothetical protein [Elusimicrobiota bacterium]
MSFGWPVLSPLGAQEPAAAPAAQPAAKCAECAPCAGAAATAPLAGCAAPLKEVVAAYQRAHEDFGRWAEKKSLEVQKIFDKEDGLKKKIQDNSTEINELKFKAGKADKKRLKELESENKGLWKELNGIAREKKDFCKSLSKEAPGQVRELNKGVELKLKESLQQAVE